MANSQNVVIKIYRINDPKIHEKTNIQKLVFSVHERENESIILRDIDTLYNMNDAGIEQLAVVVHNVTINAESFRITFPPYNDIVGNGEDAIRRQEAFPTGQEKFWEFFRQIDA